MDGDEAESFSFIPAFCQRYEAACEGNYVKTAWSNGDSGKFRAIFIVPGGTRWAHRYMRMFIGLDGAHTNSGNSLNFSQGGISDISIRSGGI
jgi:hypothetical protein